MDGDVRHPWGQESQQHPELMWSVLDTVAALVLVTDRDGRIVRFNRACEQLTGYTHEEVHGKCIWDFLLLPEEVKPVKKELARLEAGEPSVQHDHYWVGKDGTRRLIHWSHSHLAGPVGSDAYTIGTGTDVTEQRRAEQEREIAVEFLRLVNYARGTRELVSAAVGYLRDKSGCEAVGVRIKDGDDYPYFENQGFPAEFIELESSLCTRDLQGQLVRDTTGHPVHECMCGNVICGRFDPGKPFFTGNGSFWTNSTTKLLANTSEADRQSRTRNRCNGEGYESVALLPLRVGDERLGLLQLNDRRTGLFTAASISLWERLAGYLAVALAKTIAEESLKDTAERLDAHICNSPLAVIEFDAEFRVIRWSEEAARLFGWTRAEIAGKAISELRWVLEEDREAVRQVSADMLTRNCRRNVHANRNYRKDGSVVHCEWYNSAIYDADGHLTSILSQVLDVTEREHAEKKIRQRNEVLNGINRIFKEALTCQTEEELGRTCLNVAEKVTGSEFGFVGQLGADGMLHTIAISDPGWDVRQIATSDGDGRPAKQFRVRGIYGRVVTEKKTVLTNQPSAHPDSVSLPAGHPKLTSFLGAPLLRGTEAMGMIAVANRQGGYGPDDIEALEALAPVIAEAFERKRAEDSLRKSESRLRTLGDQIPGGAIFQQVQRADGSVGYAYMSAGIERLFGMPAQRVVDDPDAFRQLIVADDVPRLVATEEQSARDLTPFNCEFRQRTLSGDVRWVQCRSTPRRLPDGSIVWDGVVIDITERMRHEGQIAKLTRLYAVLSQVNEAIVRSREVESLYSEVCRIVVQEGGYLLAWIGELQGRQVVPVAAWGPGVDYLQGLRVETDGLLGNGPTGTCIREGRAIINPDFETSPTTIPWRESALRYGFHGSAAFPLRRADRAIGALTLYAPDPVAFDAEQVTLLESLSADLSFALDKFDHDQRRARAEQALRENQRRLARNLSGMTRLQELSTRLIRAGDLDSLLHEILAAATELVNADKGKIQFLDSNTRRLRIAAHLGLGPHFLEHFALDGCSATCGMARRENRRVIVGDVVAEPRLQGTADLKVFLDEGIRAVQSTPLISRDGRLLGMLCNHFPQPHRPADHELRFLDLLARMAADLIERKQAEAALNGAKQRAEAALAAAEAANRTKNQFLASMSHELRTPMNAILGMIDVALPKALDPVVLDCLQTAKGSADLLLTLLNDLLDSAKIESGKLELESAPFLVESVVDEVMRVLAVRARDKGLAFSCRLPEKMPVAVVGDRLRMQQILFNLAGNAIKFTDRGEVEIRLSTHTQDKHTALEFAVRDTGIGISREGLSRLFKPFAQADASMSRRFGGTGLGLAICKRLVELMGGRIWVTSEVGQGSTFYFTINLPITEKVRVEAERVHRLKAHPAIKRRVLLVEDNLANQKLIRYLLQERGHELEFASGGEEGIQLAKENRYDAILMDVEMPGINGLQATAVIREFEGTQRRTPIIAMTAHAMKADRERCLAAGMDAYVSKPIQAEELITLLEELPMSRGDLTAAAAEPADTAQPTKRDPAVFDPDLALTRCFDSQEMLLEMVHSYIEERESWLTDLRAALHDGDLERVAKLGHHIKGTVVYLGAEAARTAALRVEQLDRNPAPDPDTTADAVSALEKECRSLDDALSRYVPPNLSTDEV